MRARWKIEIEKKRCNTIPELWSKICVTFKSILSDQPRVSCHLIFYGNQKKKGARGRMPETLLNTELWWPLSFFNLVSMSSLKKMGEDRSRCIAYLDVKNQKTSRELSLSKWIFYSIVWSIADAICIISNILTTSPFGIGLIKRFCSIQRRLD